MTLTATRQELAALAAGARMALDVIRLDAAPPAARRLLQQVIDDYDAAIGRHSEGDPTCTSRSSSST